MSKVIVITGATNGIGKESAHQLALLGHRIVLIARSEEKASATLQTLARPENQIHTYHLADLSSIKDINRVANDIRNAEPHIDVLINNAGGEFLSCLCITLLKSCPF